MLGIENYEPSFFTKTSQFLEMYQEQIKYLAGKKIANYYLQWNTKHNSWNKDGPIVIQIDGNQYEFTAYKLEYTLTINKIDLSKKLDWYGLGDDMPLVWKKNPLEEINIILGEKIRSVYLLEHSMVVGLTDNREQNFFKGFTQADFFLVGIEFEWSAIEQSLHLSNGLDCNELKMHITIPDHKNRRIKIA